MIKETYITNSLKLTETDDHIELRIIDIENGCSCVLNQIEAIHLRNDISIWANNKRNRDLRKEKK